MTPEEITALRERIVTLESDNAALTKERDCAYQGSEAQTQEQLAAAQATIAKLRGVFTDLQEYFELGTVGSEIVTNALAIPSDTTALQERLAAERERCAKVCDDYGADVSRHPMITNGAWECAKAIRSMT